MACISPPELADRDLLVYIDGEADPQVVEHIEQCPHCRERARHLARLQDYLIRHLYRFNCPSPLELGEHYLRTLPGEQARAVNRHLAECPHCTGEVALLKDYVADLAPSLELRPMERLGGRVNVLLGHLVSGKPAPAPAYSGLRGDEAGPFIYRADDLEVIIQVHEDPHQPGLKTILGLVTGLDDTRGWEVHLWGADRWVAAAPVEELGNFVISISSSGSYDLILSGPEVEMHIQALDI